MGNLEYLSPSKFQHIVVVLNRDESAAFYSYHIYKLHYHMQPLSSGIVEDSEDSTILPMAASFKTEGLEGSCTIPLDSIAQIFVLGSKHTAWERMLMTLIYFDGVY